MKYSCDFETTTNKNDCRVWAWGVAEIETEEFNYGNSIENFFEWVFKNKDKTLYFHNLKFDGEFILYYLFRNGFERIDDKKYKKNKTFTTLISDKGLFYSIEIYFEKYNKLRKITILDSLKILPFSVSSVASAFGLTISKLEIDYNKEREKGYLMNEEEIDYLKNDVLIIAKALKILFNQGLTKMTTGSNALTDFKNIIGDKKFERWFPEPEYDADIRQAYKGGWVYLNPIYKNKEIKRGIVLDVNSLYPWAMKTQKLPFGEGIYFKGKYKEDNLYDVYVQMFTCQFELKKDKLPTIQLKNNLSFIPTEYLTSSNDEEITMCLTSIDLKIFLENYEVYNIEYISGWKFKSAVGLFDDYINKWIEIKNKSTIENNLSMRTLAKLMLNSLYGKFALNPIVCSKIPTYENDEIKYVIGEKEKRKSLYIPMGVFITAYAREKTIRSAQKVYNRFVYADTDSLHLIGEELPDLEIDNVELGAWKHELTFDRAKYIRAKTYIEETNGKLKITCAGMPENCYKFVTFDNFKEGSRYSGKLSQKRVKGGIVLEDIDFTIKRGYNNDSEI